uniref:ATP-dependent Clp protease proteolytic subunit n=1 Tax=Grammatophora oceanica TaxID=210454 RepID=A0A7S1YGN0_9STRA|mmetsp:Transcript_45963/g.68392  ORF Transcript_45963/g.68392 Transcript_45963/m.68392 type:complete len:284 (+) Transcript_45963:92-943(+)
MKVIIVVLSCILGASCAFAPVRTQRWGLATKLHGSLWTPPESSLWTPPNMMPDDPTQPPPEEPKPAPQTPPRNPPPLPTVTGESGQVDVISRLLKDRILLLGTDVNDEMANVLVAQLLYLAGEDPEADITLYINSPGGSVSAGLAIYDTMQFIKPDVATVCFGMAASMGAFLLGAGAKGKRRSLPNARIMIHQPLGGAQGAASDIEIQAQEILFVKACLNKYMAEYTGQPVEKIAEDTDRDFFMTPYEACDYGIIDEIIKTKTSDIPMPKMPSLFSESIINRK